MSSHIRIVQVTSPADMKAFINLPYDLYRGEPGWRPPLRLMQADQYLSLIHISEPRDRG